MSEVGVVNEEVAKQSIPPKTELKPFGPTKGKREFEFAGNQVEVNFVKFQGKEDPDPKKNHYDPKKAAFLLTGWPMRADAQITWGQPQILAEEFGLTTYEIDGRPKGNFNMDSIALELEGIRQFASELERNGVSEITLFGHSIGAVKAVDLVLALQQRNPNLKTNLVLINPAGLYPQDIWSLARAYGGIGIKERTKNKNPNRISQDLIPVLVDFAASIFKDIKATGPNIFKLWRDQKKKSTEFNANLAKIKSPVIIMLATDDPVFPPEEVFPQEELDKIVGSAKPDEDSRDRMARLGKARDQYAREHLLPNSSDVKVIVATKYGNHIAFGVERPRPTSHIIARYFDRVRG